MRKQILSLSILLLLLISFTTITYSHYKLNCNAIKQSCSKKNVNKGEIIFESLMKRFVGAVEIQKN